MTDLYMFKTGQLAIVNNAVAMAEELVSNHYKMSTSQWLHRRYDVKTLRDLSPGEIVHGPFAQIVRYQGQPSENSLSSANYDFFKICLQDHSIQTVLTTEDELSLMPFIVYIVTHELIHIVRFTRFLQYFDATPEEKLEEERRVHEKTHEILHPINFAGMSTVLNYFHPWRIPYDGFKIT